MNSLRNLPQELVLNKVALSQLSWSTPKLSLRLRTRLYIMAAQEDNLKIAKDTSSSISPPGPHPSVVATTLQRVLPKLKLLF